MGIQYCVNYYHRDFMRVWVQMFTFILFSSDVVTTTELFISAFISLFSLLFLFEDDEKVELDPDRMALSFSLSVPNSDSSILEECPTWRYLAELMVWP